MASSTFRTEGFDEFPGNVAAWIVLHGARPKGGYAQRFLGL